MYFPKPISIKLCIYGSMAKGKKEGFQSAAGLIRYFDAEEKTALQIDPRIVMGLCIATAIAVTVLKYLYPT